jgi:lysophospholipase L1-like esterase
MSATPDGGGYWLVGADAGVFTFGDALYAGSAESPLHPPLFPAGFSYNIAPAVTIMPDVAGPQAAHQGQLRVAFAGDSIGFYEGEYALGTNPPYFIDNGAAPGCGFTNGGELLPWSNPGAVYTSPAACALWAQQVEWLTARFHPDVTVIQLGYWESQYRQFEGSYQTLTDQTYDQYIQANIQQAVTLAHADGGAVILNTSPYFDDGTPNSLVDSFNQIVNAVASANSTFVSVFNVNSLLDPDGVYSTVVNGVVARTPDGVHVTEAGVQDVLVPPLNQLISEVGGAAFSGTS